MKLSHFVLATALFIAATQISALAQGSLTPPGAPGPTMKTLSQVEPRISISSLPYLINSAGSYYFTTNLAGATGITISSGDVTIDLNGFRLEGASSTSSGIFISSTFTNITVRNGAIAGWKGSGIDGYSSGYPRNVFFEHLLVSSNAQDGIVAEAGSIIRNCQFLCNGTAANAAGVWSAGGEIVDCLSRSNSGYGILINNGTVRNCRSEYNATGIQIYNGMVIGCTVAYSSTYGIYMDGGNDAIRQCHITGTNPYGILVNSGQTTGGVIADCFVNGNSYGIFVSSPGFQITGNEVTQNNAAGIYLQSSNNRVDGNTLIPAPGGFGVQVSANTYTNNVVVRNVASGGGSFNYVNPGNNDFGPIGTAATATSPWANISHP